MQGAALKAQNFYYVAVTDWSLFVMDRGGSGEGAVLVELPWLGVWDLVSGAWRMDSAWRMRGWGETVTTRKRGAKARPVVEVHG